MKKFKGFLAACSLTIFGMTMLLATEDAYASNVMTMQTKTTTDVNKAWTITFSDAVDAETVTEDSITITDEHEEEVALQNISVNDETIIVTAAEAYEIGTYVMNIDAAITSTTGEALAEAVRFEFTVSPHNEEDVVFGEAGTFGDDTYLGNVTITESNTTLQNAVVEGDLTIAASVADGEVYLENVEVLGRTIILGGGENSVYVEDSTLSTTVVNRPNGVVRVVAQGDTFIDNVLLESQAILQEQSLQGEGFTNVEIQERVANSDGQVQLNGIFNTVNARATNATLSLSEQTIIEQLILAATSIVNGEATIETLTVAEDAANSIVQSRPLTVVVHNGTSITIAGQLVNESYSAATTTEIQSIDVNPVYVKINMTNKLFDLTNEDFKVTANGQVIPTAYFDAAANLLYFEQPLTSYEEVTVSASNSTTKVMGTQTMYTSSDNGFYGRVTDIYGVGVANATVLVEGHNRAVTDENGYYFMPIYYAENTAVTGTVSAIGYVDQPITANLSENVANNHFNYTIIRAASSDEWKIRLTWNGEEADVDSHLASENFHVFYSEKVYTGPEGYEYVDLDWDDTEYYGPETTTIREFEDGRYVFFLHNYSGEKYLEASDSKVEIFKGSNVVADYTYTVPTKTNGENYWGVFELYVTNNGESIEVRELNTMAPDEFILKSPKNRLQEAINMAIEKNANPVLLTEAKALLNNGGTSKQYIEAYNYLYNHVTTYDLISSSYLSSMKIFGDKKVLEADGYYSQTIALNEPKTYTLKSSEIMTEELEASTLLDVRIHVGGYNNVIGNDVTKGKITLTSNVTDETMTIDLSHSDTSYKTQMTYEQFLATFNYDLTVQLNEVGHYNVNVSISEAYPADENYYGWYDELYFSMDVR